MNNNNKRLHVRILEGGMPVGARLYAIIERAYGIIGDNTPVDADCGKLCNAACCQGDDEVGMLLFPGEAARLSKVPGFRVTRIDYMDGKAWLLTCDGVCERGKRPLACRIFPLGPHFEADGTVRAVPDPRGRGMCPLATGKYLDRRFKRAVGRVFTMLAREPQMRAFLEMLARELDELSALNGGV